MPTITILDKPRSKRFRIEIDLDRWEKLADSLGFYRPEFLDTLGQSIRQSKERRVRKIKSLRELEHWFFFLCWRFSLPRLLWRFTITCPHTFRTKKLEPHQEAVWSFWVDKDYRIKFRFAGPNKVHLLYIGDRKDIYRWCNFLKELSSQSPQISLWTQLRLGGNRPSFPPCPILPSEPRANQKDGWTIIILKRREFNRLLNSLSSNFLTLLDYSTT